MDLLKPLGATSMFAKKTDLGYWISRMNNNQVAEKIFEVKEEVSTREWIKNKEKEEDILPVIIIGTEGRKRPFHYGDQILPGEKVIYLQ